MGQKKRVLITVKTYPNPSASYMELVCTGGVLEDGSFIRLYPIDYRYRPYWQWYRKYQWVEVEVEKNKKDGRPESYRPVLGTPIKPLGEPLPTDNNWAERKKHVLARPLSTMCELQSTSQKQRSLSIIKPRQVMDLVAKPTARDWRPEQKARMNQLQLFGPSRKPLEKIPYKFSYKYKCEAAGCNGHNQMIEDWEVGALYRRVRDESGSEETAVQKVRQKFLDQLCAPLIDTHFFVGTVLKHGTWVILGVFYPKKS